MSDRKLSERLAEDMGLHKWAAEARALADERDALRAKLEKVRALLEAGPECSDARCYISRDTLTIIEGEGDT